MFKKISIMLLSAVLVCMAFATVSSAAGSCKAEVEYAVEGESLVLTVTYSDYNDDDGIIGVSCNVMYDSEVLEYQSVNAQMPSEWGDKADDWSDLYATGNVLVAFLSNTGELGGGTTDPLSFTVTFKILKTGVDTAIEVKNSELTEAGKCEIITAANTSINVTISDGGDVSVDVSEEIPDESSEDVPDESNTPSEDPENESSVPSEESASDSSVPANDSDASVSDDEESNGWLLWVIIGAAVVIVAAAVVLVIATKKNKE